MYKHILGLNGPREDIIHRLEDGMYISLVGDSSDYQAYLKWLEEGNTPLPADEPTA